MVANQRPQRTPKTPTNRQLFLSPKLSPQPNTHTHTNCTPVFNELAHEEGPQPNRLSHQGKPHGARQVPLDSCSNFCNEKAALASEGYMRKPTLYAGIPTHTHTLIDCTPIFNDLAHTMKGCGPFASPNFRCDMLSNQRVQTSQQCT